MPENRVFIPQDALDAWLAEDRVAIDGELLTLKSEGQRFKLKTAVRFMTEVAGGGDQAKLIGKVKDLDQLKSLGGDYSSGSVVLNDDAYEVIEGFVGEPMHEAAAVATGTSLAAATRAAAGDGADKDLDLLARFFLKS
jgi:hypothetical protein